VRKRKTIGSNFGACLDQRKGKNRFGAIQMKWERKGGIKLKHMNSIAVYDDIIVVRN
jgi:hypothetical protein